LFKFKKKFVSLIKKKKSGRTNFNGILLFKRTPPKFKKRFNSNERLYLSTTLATLMCYLPSKKTGTVKGIIKYANGGFSCINSPLGLKIGQIIKTVLAISYKLEEMGKVNLGDTILLHMLKQRSVFFNVTSPEQNKNTLAKSAGTYCYIISYERSKGYTKIQMPSGNQKYVYNFTFVTLGRNSNPNRG
jgi:ribosomal protein L2